MLTFKRSLIPLTKLTTNLLQLKQDRLTTCFDLWNKFLGFLFQELKKLTKKVHMFRIFKGG